MFEWLAEVCVQKLPIEKELEIPDIFCLVMIKGFSGLGKLYCYVKLSPPHEKDAEDCALQQSHKMQNGKRDTFQKFGFCVFFAPDFKVRDVAAHLGELKGMGAPKIAGAK